MSTYYEFWTIEQATAFAKQVKYFFMLDSQVLDSPEEFPPTVSVDHPTWQALIPGWQVRPENSTRVDLMPLPSASKKKLAEWQRALSSPNEKNKWRKFEKRLEKLEDETWEKVDELAAMFGGENTGT